MMIHGLASKITEEVGGHIYGARVTFRDPDAAPSTAITTARVHSISSPSGTTKRLVFARRPVSFSETVTMGPRDTREDEWQSLCGGNVVWTPEPARFYSHNEPRSWRGNDQGGKAMLGDVVRHGGRSFPITAAVAFGDENPSPAWQDEAAPPVVRIRADIAGVRIPLEDAEGEIITESPATRDGWDGLPSLVDDASAYLSGVRLSFAQSFSVGPLGSSAYWHDEGFRYRFGAFGDPATIIIVWYERLFERIGARDSSELDTYVLAGGEAWTWSPAENAETTFFAYPGGDGAFGEGYVEWRSGSEHEEPPFLRVSWSGKRLVSATYRLTDGGDIFTSGWSPPAVDFTGAFFNVGFVKSGRDVTARFIPQGSETFSTIHHLADFLPAASEGGKVVAGGNVKVVGFGNNLVFGDPSALLQRWLMIPEARSYQDVTLPSPGGSMAVRNATIDAAMTSGSARRDRYSVVSGKLRLYGETEWDEVTVTWPPSLPPGGGRPPRPQPGTVDFTDGAMRAGWRDYVDVYDPDGALGVLPGEDVEIRRERVFDAQQPPTIQIKEEGASWQTLTAADMLARWPEGEILLRQDLLDTLSASWQIRAVGRIYRQSGNCRSRQANEIAIAVDELEKLWIEVGTPVGAGTAIGGTMGLSRLVLDSQSCNATYGAVNTGWTMSQPRGDFSQEVEDLLAAGAAFPYWRDVNQYRAIVGGGVMGYTAAHVDEWFACGAGGGYNRTGWSAEAQRATIWMEGRPGAVGADFGAPNSPRLVTDGPTGQEHWALGPAAAQFNVMSLPFNLRGTLVARIPEGAEILEAYIPVRVQDATFTSWSLKSRFNRSWVVGAVLDTAATSTLQQIRFFGELWSDYERSGNTVLRNNHNPEVDQSRSSGSASLSLIGRRDADQQVFLPLTGQWAPRTAALFRSFGAGVASGGSLQSGKWRRIECSALVREMIRARSSIFPETSLWPSNAGVNVSASTAHLTSYLRSLEPVTSFSASLSGDIWTIEIEQSGQWTNLSSMQLGTIMARFRLPSGIVSEALVPIVARVPF